MKNIFIFSILALSVFFSACDDDKIINLEPTANTDQSYYQTEAQMQAAVYGMYQKFTFFYGYRAGANNTLYNVTLLPSDDVTSLGTMACENFEQLNGNTRQVYEYYQFAYQLIARANVVLEKIETNGDFVYKTANLKDWHKGEALFLRAYMYFCLWNVFGTAPLVTERIVELDKAYVPNSAGTELLDRAISDLEEAARLLPASWAAAHLGRATKNSALGLRGKCLVFRGTVNKANADFVAALADFNALSGLSLTPAYGTNFESATENNAESLFEFQANRQPGTTNTSLNNDEFAVVGEIGHYVGMFMRLPTGLNDNFFTATVSIREAYEEGDPRRDYNLNMSATDRINIMKYTRAAVWTQTNNTNGVTNNNPRLLRYADVLLLKAEAIVRTGGSLSEAIGLINQVRERARNSATGDTPSAVPADRDVSEADSNVALDWIFQERRLELAFEDGHRWWDLRRRHIAGEINLSTWDFSSLNLNFAFKGTNVYFPLPTREVADNPNLRQNDGY